MPRVNDNGHNYETELSTGLERLFTNHEHPRTLPDGFKGFKPRVYDNGF
jgi:hypothetical protein